MLYYRKLCGLGIISRHRSLFRFVQGLIIGLPAFQIQGELGPKVYGNMDQD